MAKQTLTQEVQERIKSMIEKKTAELDQIQKKQGEARTQIEAATLAIKDATERMDLDAYEEAKQAKHKAQTALDMYAGRYNQIKAQEYISEEESDKVIASLLNYENELGADFEAAIVAPIEELKRLLKEYQTATQEIETTLATWTGSIHANYHAYGTTFSNGTDKDGNPHPIRRGRFEGCGASQRVETFLKNDLKG